MYRNLAYLISHIDLRQEDVLCTMMQLGDLCVAELFCKKVPRNISEVSQELPLYKIVLASPSDFGVDHIDAAQLPMG